MSQDDKPEAIIPEVVPRGPQEEVMAELRSFAESKKNPQAEKYVDWVEFKKAAQRFMPLKSIAPHLGMHRNTLNNHCQKEFELTSQEVWEKFAASGKRVLTSKMYDLAVNGHFPAQQWLSKNYMGMREPEKQEPKTGGNAEPTEIIYEPKVIGLENLTEDSIKEMMGRYLDLPQTHSLKKGQTEIVDEATSDK